MKEKLEKKCFVTAGQHFSYFYKARSFSEIIHKMSLKTIGKLSTVQVVQPITLSLHLLVKLVSPGS